jgi:hypothetical protein
VGAVRESHRIFLVDAGPRNRRCSLLWSAMDATKLFIEQKTRQAVLALDAARGRAARERSLLALALIVSRVDVNHLVKPLPSVRAAAFRLRSESERHAAQLAAEQLARFRAEPRSAQGLQELQDTFRACRGVFPREAAALRLLLDAD